MSVVTDPFLFWHFRLICFRLLLLLSFPPRSYSLVSVVGRLLLSVRFLLFPSGAWVPPLPQGRLRGRCPRSWCHKSLPRFSAIHSLRSPSISRSYSYCRRWYVDTKLIALPSIKVWLARGEFECPTLETNTWPFLSLFLEYSELSKLPIHELSNRPR